MSDTGNKMNVEDVLSSIRRLVSEEARSAYEQKSAPEGEPGSPPRAKTPGRPVTSRPEKLVLTPAFRVSEQKTHGPDPSEIEKRIADIETLVLSEVEAAGDINAPEPDQSEPQTNDIPPKAAIEIARPEDTASAEADPDAPDAPPLHAAARIIQPITAGFETQPATEPPQSPAHDPVDGDDSDDIGTSDWPDSDPAPDAADPTGLHTPSDILPEPEQDSGYQSDIDFTTEREPLLDEETLREIVSEMVRSELQGELGDRITRNVRKLVRREIRRALASRDIESRDIE